MKSVEYYNWCKDKLNMIDAWTSVHDQKKLGVTYNRKRPYTEATHIDNLLVSFWHLRSDI